MDTVGIGEVGGNAASAGPVQNGLEALGSDAFLQLLVAQLRYQNPMNPGDGTEMLQQTAQFTTVETLQAISEAQNQLLGLSQVNLAVGVVGKPVAAIDLDGRRIFGTVDSIRFTADGPMLRIGSSEVPLDNVVSIDDPAEHLTEV